VPSRGELGGSGLARAQTPDELGVPTAAVRALIKRLQHRGLITHSLLIARDGVLAYENYAPPYGPRVPHRLYSISKSYVAVAVGTLIDDGWLRLEDPVMQYFPELITGVDLHPYLAAARVEDLLTMRSPHAATTYKRARDPDWVRTFFTVPPSRPPGMLFAYDTSATVVLTAIVERLSGLGLVDYLMDRVLRRIGVEHGLTALFSPTGMTPARRGGQPSTREVLNNPNGVTHGGSGLLGTPRDLLRFAQLCLNDGRWGADQIVSTQYMRAATGYQTATIHTHPGEPDNQCGYGYQFWRTRHGFAARGMGSQVALCVPSQALVIVTTGDNQGIPGADQIFFDAVWEEVLPALSSPASPAASDSTGLAPAARGAKASDVIEATPPSLHLPVVPTGEQRPEGVSATFALAPAQVAYVGLTIRVGQDDGELRLQGLDGTVARIPFGVGRHRVHPLPGYDYETYSSGAWIDPRTVHIHSHVLGHFHAQIRFTLTLTLDGQRVILMMDGAAEMFAEEFSGTANGHRIG